MFDNFVLSILHNLLNSIYSTLDETTKSKIGNELIEILEELNDLKKNKLTGCKIKTESLLKGWVVFIKKVIGKSFKLRVNK